LLREQFIHVRGGHIWEQRDNALIAAKRDGSANEVFDGSSTFGFHPPPRSVSYACLGCCHLLGKIERQTARLDPLSEVRHLVIEGEKHWPYMAF
jgi:hypothetical protein